MNKFFKTLIFLNTFLIIGSVIYFYKFHYDYYLYSSIQSLENQVSSLERKVEENESEISDLESEVSNLKSDLDFIRIMNDLY